MATELILQHGHVIVIDDDDVPYVLKHKWAINRGNGYAYTMINRKRVYLHAYLLQPPANMVADHISRNINDYRRSNLRIATMSDNARNAVRRRGRFGYIGVHSTHPGSYFAAISVNNRQIYLGSYRTAKEAAIARDKAARELHGEFAVLNFPDEDH